MPLPFIVVQGNVCLDPQLTITDKGNARLVLRIASGERKKDAEGNWVDGDSTFLNCTLWGNKAEAAAETITKGTPVVVVGELRMRTVENDNGKVTYYDVDAREVSVNITRSQKREESTDPWAVTSPF